MTPIYNTNSQINFKTSILESSSCDYGHAYILVKEIMTFPNTKTAGA